MKKLMNKHIIGLCLCIFLVTAAVFTVSFQARYQEHRCSDKDCAICCQIEFARTFARQLSDALLYIISFLPQLAVILPGSFFILLSFQIPSPVKLKVRMDY